jgi:hypothetical protein
MAGLDGSGTMTRAYDWTTDRDAGVKVRADRSDVELDNIAAALNVTFFRDGRATATAAWAMGGYKIAGLGTPTLSGDAATKGYVDSVATPGTHVTCVAATTANITIATALNNADTIDTIVLATGDKVLVKNQTAPEENGVYIVGVSPARSTSFDTFNEHVGAVAAVSGGSTNANTLWLCMVNSGGTLNTTAITFASAGAAVSLPLSLASGGLGVALTAPAADNLPFYDLSAGIVAWLAPTTGIQITGTSLTLDINGLSEDTSPAAGDYFPSYDASATTHKKVSLSKVGMLGIEDQALAGGAIVTSKSLGTQSSGTLTLDMGARPLQHYTNGGAHTLAPGTNNGACMVDITNNASAGAITTSGWTKVSGSFDTTNAHKFRCHCSVGNAGSLLVVQGLQ